MLAAVEGTQGAVEVSENGDVTLGPQGDDRAALVGELVGVVGERYDRAVRGTPRRSLEVIELEVGVVGYDDPAKLSSRAELPSDLRGIGSGCSPQ